jgi:hypothetical protein
MENLSRSVEIKVQGNTYTLNMPNNRQLIAIEAMKARLSLGTYDSMMINSQSMGSQNALNLVDMIANFTVLAPDILKDLKVDISELNIMDSLVILKIYMEKIQPWVLGWQKLLNDVANSLAKQNEEVDGEEDPEG